MTKIKTSNEEKTMVQPRSFEERVNGEFSAPGEAANALLEAEDRLPDPTVTLGASFALKATAEALAVALKDRRALHSPAMAAEVLRDSWGALEALASAMQEAVEAMQLARCGGDVPDDAREALDEAEEFAHQAATNARHAGQKAVRAARRLDSVEYVGYTDCGRAAQFAAVVAALEQPGVELGAVHEAGPRNMASIEFTYRGGTWVLVDDASMFGWELMRFDGETSTEVKMRAAHTSTVHPAAIADEALAATGRHLDAARAARSTRFEHGESGA